MIRWFDSIPARTLPHTAPPFVVCLMLTAAEGSYRSRLVCLDRSGKTTFSTHNHSVDFPHLGQTVWASFRIRSATFRTAGIYRVLFICENQVLTERTLRIRYVGGNGDV
jgi:hypothetical protein